MTAVHPNAPRTREMEMHLAPRLTAENAELRAALRNLLSCEPKNAANYIRQEFANARALVARLDGAK